MPPHFVRTRTEIETVLAAYGHDHDEITGVLAEFTRGPAANLFTPEAVAQLCTRLEH